MNHTAGGPLKLLLVEDDHADARRVEGFLREMQVDAPVVKRVERLHQAVELLQQEGFSAILLDLDLPDSKGLETIARAHADAAEAPILVLAGVTNEELAAAAVREGAQDYLIKHEVDARVLRRAIHYAIERKRAEANIRWLTLAVEQSPASVFMTDTDGKVLYVNETFTRVSGYTAAEALGKKAGLVKSGLTRPEVYRNLWDTIRAGGTWRGELQNRRKNGELYWDAVTISPLRDHRGTVTHFLAVQQDITERKQSDHALRDSEERFRQLAENIQDVFYIVDAQYRETLYISPAYERVWGRTCRSLYEQPLSFAEPVHPEDRERLFGSMSEIQKGADPGEIEFRIVQPGGGVRWVSSRAVPIRDERGAVYRIAGIARDITDRKAAEVALQARERQLRAVVEAVNDIVFEFDADGTYLNVWAADETKLAAPRSDLLGRRVADVLGEAAARPFVERFRRVLQSGVPETFEYSLPLVDGEHHFQARVQRLAGAAGGADTVGMGIADVTQQKQAEDAARASDRRLRHLFETVNLVVLGLDAEGRVDYVNPYLLTLTGYTREEAIGSDWIERFLPEAVKPQLRAVLRELIERDVHPYYQNPIITKAGHERMISWHNIVVRDPQGRATGTLSIGEDITDRSRLEMQLRQAQKMEAVGRLAGGVAHDFNNLLTVIIGEADLAVREVTGGTPVADSLGEIRKAGDRATALTRQLLAFSRQQPVDPTAFSLNEVVSEMDKMFRRLIGEDITVDTRLASDLPLIRADRGQMEQVLANLVVNARDAMPHGGRLLIETSTLAPTDARIETTGTLPAGRYVVLSVTDTGAGMDASTRSRIFEPFFTTKAAGKGTGLGLSTVFGIVQQAGGQIGLYSELRVGTTFRIYLPAATGVASTEAARLAAPRGGAENVLLVEDEAGVRRLARGTLERLGYHVLEAANPDDALQVAAEFTDEIQLLVTDIVMPGSGGPDLVAQLLPLRPQMRVLYTSGYTERAITVMGGPGPAPAFLQKPFTPDELGRKVRQVLDG